MHACTLSLNLCFASIQPFLHSVQRLDCPARAFNHTRTAAESLLCEAEALIYSPRVFQSTMHGHISHTRNASSSKVPLVQVGPHNTDKYYSQKNKMYMLEKERIEKIAKSEN